MALSEPYSERGEAICRAAESQQAKRARLLALADELDDRGLKTFADDVRVLADSDREKTAVYQLHGYGAPAGSVFDYALFITGCAFSFKVKRIIQSEFSNGGGSSGAIPLHEDYRDQFILDWFQIARPHRGPSGVTPGFAT